MKGQAGFSLLEVLVAVALIASTGIAILTGLNTVSATTIQTDKRESASNLAQLEMEYVKGQVFAAEYPPQAVPPSYNGYVPTIAVTSLHDGNVQSVVVTVWRDGVVAATLEGYKVR